MLAGLFLAAGSCLLAQVPGENSFVNGSQYQDVYPGARGHPFFLDEEWASGYLATSMGRFDSLTLRYDIHIDRLIYNHVHPTGVYQVVLNPGVVDAFGVHGHHFQKMKDGFYEILASGKATLYLRYSKKFNAQANQSRGAFTEYRERYIYMEGQYHQVKGKRSLLNILSDREKELRAFMRKNQLYPGSDRDSDIRRVITYYNSLQ